MRTLLIASCFLLSAFTMFGAAIPGTVILNKITLGDDSITNKSIGDTVEMKGTPKQVADTAARDAIPAARRTEGMEAWVIDESKVYRLVGGILNANWEEVVGGGGLDPRIASSSGRMTAGSNTFAATTIVGTKLFADELNATNSSSLVMTAAGQTLNLGSGALTLSGSAGGYLGVGGGLSYTGSGNNGNLPTTVDTLQELNDAVDNLAIVSGSVTNAVNILKENGSQVGDPDITTLDFLGADFDLTESPNQEVNVVISSAIARDAEVAAAYQPLGAVDPRIISTSGTMTAGSNTFAATTLVGTKVFSDEVNATNSSSLVMTAGGLTLNLGSSALTLSGASGGFLGVGGGLTYTGSGNNGNLTTSVNTLQELNDAVDNLSLGAGGGATNAVTTVSTNGVALTTAATNLNFWQGTGIMITGTNLGGLVGMRFDAGSALATDAEVAAAYIASSLGAGTNNSFTGSTNYGNSFRTNWTWMDARGWHNTNNSAANQGVDISAGAITANSFSAVTFNVGTVNLTNALSLAGGGTGSSLSDPGAHRLWGWDDTDGAVKWFTLGSGLSYDAPTDTISATGGGSASFPLITNTMIVTNFSGGLERTLNVLTDVSPGGNGYIGLQWKVQSTLNEFYMDNSVLHFSNYGAGNFVFDQGVTVTGDLTVQNDLTVEDALIATSLSLATDGTLQIPRASVPAIDALGKMGVDTDLYSASRGAVMVYDGTEATVLVGVLATETPVNGQTPVWNTGGTVTWNTGPSLTGTNAWTGSNYFQGITAFQSATISTVLISSFEFEGPTVDAFYTRLTAVDPTAIRTNWLPNATGVLVLETNVTSFSNKKITLSVGLLDDTYTGTDITGMNAGATVAQWETVYLSSGAEWVLADANGSSTYPAIALAAAAGTDNNPMTVVVSGTIRNDAWSWTVGGTIYLSATPGALTQTAPSGSGDKVQVMGVALSADIMLLKSSSDYGTAP